jgi:hypothetical protein
VTVKSRTFVAAKVWVRPSALTEVRSPLVARTSGREVAILTTTERLDGVSNGSPWLGRSKAILRLTHWQPAVEVDDPVRLREQPVRAGQAAPQKGVEPDPDPRRRVDRRMPPSGTTIV